jgi:hypothetical protein
MEYGEIRKEKESDYDVQLHMMIHYMRDGRQFARPRSIVRWCSASFLNTIRELGVECVKKW